MFDYTGKIVWNTSQPNGQPRRCVSYEKAKQNSGFEPKITLDDGLQKTIDWYLNHEEVWKDLTSSASNPTPWKNNQ